MRVGGKGLNTSERHLYHPASNGEAKRFVQTFKHAMRAGEKDEGSLSYKLANFLLSYQTMPHVMTGIFPA